MAALGAVYTIECHRRTPEQIVESLFHDPKDKQAEKGMRPEPQHNRICAILTRSTYGNSLPAMGAGFGWMGLEIRLRYPHINLHRNYWGTKPRKSLLNLSAPDRPVVYWFVARFR
jgi:hypothetical protein